MTSQSGRSNPPAVLDFFSEPLLRYNEGRNRVPYDLDPSLWREEFQWPFYNTGEATHVRDATGGVLSQYDEPTGTASAEILTAWGYQRHAKDITVALIDLDFDVTHPDLAGRFLPGVRITQGNVIPLTKALTVRDAHGTLGAGIVGATGDNEHGISGVCRDGVRLLPIAPVTWADFARAIRYAADSGARIINLPFGTSVARPDWREAIGYARSRGVLIVCAAANPPWPTTDYPCDWVDEFDNLLLVGGHTRAGTAYASGGYQEAFIHLLAPARLIVSTYPGGEFRYTSGCSFAAPFVSGAAALCMQRFSHENYLQTKRRLMQTVTKLPGYSGRCRSNGALNVYSALKFWGNP